ncbi:MAG: HAMP domain-containing histidine kinase [Spirochaetales bacterium]|nr:HAMP domain-containing histidine kinase [Spirochaetales bacterium]
MSKRQVIQNEYHPLTVMAHDIKSPLTAIVDLLYVIEKGYVTDIDKSKELVSRARTKALELVKMVDDILDYTLLAHKDNVKQSRLDLTEIVVSSMSTLSVLASQKGVTIAPLEAKKCPCYILGNRVFLLRAFHNLIMNAIKYNKEGGVIYISIIPLKEERQIKIIIKDTGIGIDEDDLKRVFDIFHRGKRARKNIDGSLGLGLSLVRQIINGHDGTIDIESKSDYGTTITLVLPLIGGENE